MLGVLLGSYLDSKFSSKDKFTGSKEMIFIESLLSGDEEDSGALAGRCT